MRIRDWSSDVCSSDLHGAGLAQRLPRLTQHHPPKTAVRKTPQGDSVKKLSTLLIAGAAIAVAAPVHAKKTQLTVSSWLPPTHAVVADFLVPWGEEISKADRTSTRLNSSH